MQCCQYRVGSGFCLEIALRKSSTESSLKVLQQKRQTKRNQSHLHMSPHRILQNLRLLLRILDPRQLRRLIMISAVSSALIRPVGIAAGVVPALVETAVAAAGAFFEVVSCPDGLSGSVCHGLFRHWSTVVRCRFAWWERLVLLDSCSWRRSLREGQTTSKRSVHRTLQRDFSVLSSRMWPTGSTRYCTVRKNTYDIVRRVNL